MKTLYECEICGYQSENSIEIKKCEFQGQKNKFSLNQRFKIGSACIISEVEVKEIRFRKRTHKVSYIIKIIRCSNHLFEDMILRKTEEQLEYGRSDFKEIRRKFKQKKKK